MFIYIISTIVIILGLLLAFIAMRVDKKALRNKGYYEITLFLGSGGHTGEICELLKGFSFAKVMRINILTAQNDSSSLSFFRKSLDKELGKEQFDKVMEKVRVFEIRRTNEVKQSKVSAIFPTLLSLLDGMKTIVMSLLSTTHFISTGPGTCVPLFYTFFLLKKLKMSRVRLIFLESWCRVVDLSLSGKLLRPIADDFIVHWPESAQKYKNCQYLGQVIWYEYPDPFNYT